MAYAQTRGLIVNPFWFCLMATEPPLDAPTIENPASASALAAEDCARELRANLAVRLARMGWRVSVEIEPTSRTEIECKLDAGLDGSSDPNHAPARFAVTDEPVELQAKQVVRQLRERGWSSVAKGTSGPFAHEARVQWCVPD